MSKNIRTIYLYIVSFISLFMIVVGVISTVAAMASYKYPQVYYYDSNTYEKEYVIGNITDTSYDYNEELLKRISDRKREHLREVYSSLAIVIVGTPLFMYHWGKVQKEFKKEGVN